MIYSKNMTVLFPIKLLHVLDSTTTNTFLFSLKSDTIVLYPQLLMPLLTTILFYRLPKRIAILSNLIKQNLIKHYGGIPMDNMIMTVPIHLKMTLTIKEAAEYSNIGINKIDSMLRSPNCPFVLFVGTKRLVKRKEFEHFISQQLII